MSEIFHLFQLDQRRRIYSHHSDPSGVILDESQSGGTINIQRGFDQERNKSGHREESEINTGDSSSIQKSRHSSSSSSNVVTSETRRIQLSGSGNKPDVLVTTYTQNSSGTGSIGTGDLTSANRGAIFHTESSGYGGTETLGVFRGNDDSLNSRTPVPEEPYGSRANQGGENRWSVSSSESELLRQQEYQRRQQEEEAARIERQRKKEQLLIAQRQREEEERLYYQERQEEERRRLREEELRRREDERRKQEEEIRRRQEDERRRIAEEAYKIEQERRYGASSGSYGSQDGFITGDREETIRGGEFGFQLRNVSSKQELEQLFGSLSKSVGYELQNKQGRNYVQFMGRFRNSADREYIEFQDGSTFALQDRYGGQSYTSEGQHRDGRFLRMEGELLIDSTGKGFIVLKDGRRFPLQGSFSYTEERTINLGDPRYQQGTISHNYSRTWNEGSNHTGDLESEYESRYSSTHEERRTEDRRVTSRVYGRENRESLDEDTVTKVPNYGSRFKRESDMVDLKEFRKFETLRRSPRDLAKDPPMGESGFDGKIYEIDTKAPQEPSSPCDTARCVMLRCVLGPLKKDQEVWISARYRVDARTLKKVALQEKVRVSTKLVARVTKQPYIGTPAEQVVKSHEIKTNVEPSVTPSVPDVVPLWVVVLSACAGTIILLLLIFLLHKVCLLKIYL